MKPFTSQFKIIPFVFLAFCLFLLSSNSLLAESVRSANTEARFITEKNSIQPGESFWVALEMKMDEGWHTYWINPGDAGLATSIDWKLPDGVTASNISYPIPKRYDTTGIISYGYAGTAYLLTKISTTQNIPSGEITLEGHVRWLACLEACIPGEAKLSTTITVGNDSILNPAFEDLREQAFDELPLKQNDSLSIFYQETPEAIILSFERSVLKENPTDVFFYPNSDSLIENEYKQTFVEVDDEIQLILKKSEYAPKTLSPENLKGLLQLSYSDSQETISLENFNPKEISSLTTTDSQENSGPTLPLVLLFAFLGGAILNLMPCVLPVLSIKILNLVEHSRSHPQLLMKEGLLYTLGVLVSFWILAGALLALRFVGLQVGWGFQFQSPGFIIFMSFLFTWLGLSLFGVFEIGTSLTSVEGKLQKKGLQNNSFFNGILATIVATPCTAPFMGSAIGFALFKPAFYSFMVFTALGLGLASPYLIISKFPSCLRFIPKPGAWMNQLKKFFGFLFIATALWLAWIFGEQNGLSAMVILLYTLLFISLLGWIWGQWANLAAPVKRRRILNVLIVLGIILSFWFALNAAQKTKKEAQVIINSQGNNIQWIDYRPEKLAKLRGEGKAIFLDFTAAWCLTCKVNEKRLFSNKTIARFLKDGSITPVKADWTNYDPEVTKALETFGKSSIPLYVIYPPYPNSSPLVLSELPGVDRVIKILENIKSFKKQNNETPYTIQEIETILD